MSLRRTTSLLFLCLACSLAFRAHAEASDASAPLPIFLSQSAPSAGINDTVAAAEMSALAEALDFVALDTGYFVPLEALDDMVLSPPTNGSIDNINRNGGARVIRPEDGFFRSTPITFTGAQWFGPYIAYQQGKIQTAPTPYDPGSPLDPWGTPYFFFSPLGLIRGEPPVITQEYYGDRFDRYTIVSFGPDGAFGGGNDLAWEIPVTISNLAISSISGTGAGNYTSLGGASPGTTYKVKAGTRIKIKGRNLGGGQPGSGVTFGAADLTAGVVTWTATAVTLDLPIMVSGESDLRVSIGASQSNALHVIILPNAVEGWELYE